MSICVWVDDVVGEDGGPSVEVCWLLETARHPSRFRPSAAMSSQMYDDLYDIPAR